MRVLWMLAIAACYRHGDITFDPPDEAESLVLVVIDGEISGARAMAPRDPIPLSLRPDSKLYLLAFDRPLSDLGLTPGTLMLAAGNDPGRMLPDPMQWSAGSIEGFGPWMTTDLPDDAAELRLASVSIAECWREGGCIAADPFFCKIPCNPTEVSPPLPPRRGPIAPEPVDPPRMPQWVPARLQDCPLGSAHFYGGPAFLRDGIFRNNGTALRVLGPLAPEQVLGVSLDGNDLDLVE